MTITKRMKNPALDHMRPGESGANAALRAEGLTKVYHGAAGEVQVFENVNLVVRAGERLALTGESGTGKSTLLHLLGLLDEPTGGRIFYGDAEVTALDLDARADVRNRQVGFVWQENTLLPEFSALENVAMPLRIRGIGKHEAEQAAAERLKEVGLSPRALHRAGELSGGEQQRVALARALVGEPRLLLADEPTGSLDAKTGAMVMDLLEALHAQRSIATVYVTHNLGFASRADRVLELESGRLVSSV
ncbi:MAG: ABC transporter ATP-binding protein [Bryobacteraceae bacterium]|nr:ABC transporter ATP-binding protein [Bryobacteraceae bacterium]